MGTMPLTLINRIYCLTNGYVRLITWLHWDMARLYVAIKESNLQTANEMLDEDDLIAANAAWVSTAKEAEELSPRAIRLIKYIAERAETSPFRHCILQFEVKAPLMAARQWFKYRVGSAYTEGDDAGFDDLLYARNEMSRRYVTAAPEFYVPTEWRLKPEGRNKQGSSGPMSLEMQAKWEARWYALLGDSLKQYEEALADGMAPEMARMFLPAYGLYLTWRWTASLVAVCHFLNERLEDKAQKEIQEYALAIWRLTNQPAVYPISSNLLVKRSADVG